MSELIRYIYAFFIDNWITQVFLVVFLTLVIVFVAQVLLRPLQRLLRATRTLWDDAFLDAVRRPLSLLILVIGISIAAGIAFETQATVLEIVSRIRELGTIAAFTWFLFLLIRNGEKAYLTTEREGETVDRATVVAIGKLLRWSVVITGVLVALETLGFSISGVLAFGGIGGIAVGFAAKDLLANFFGGLMISMYKPFAVGDWVRSPDKEIEGVVEHISWRLTRIRTFDLRPLYVPNSTFSTIALENPSRMTNRRIYEIIGLRHEDASKMAAIIQGVKKMLLEHPEIDSDQLVIVNFVAFAPSSLDFFVYAFSKTTDWVHFHEVKQDVLLKLIEIIKHHGAELASPTSTLNLPGGVEILPPDKAPPG
ncbi:MAG: mechanosensitive ion channel family protein [SAR324 cluster bacterium]|nr:mechanosensitive ion channel family protein [SAR324 cluster bacterium]